MTSAVTVLRGAGRVWLRDWTVWRHVARWLLVPSLLDPIVFLVAMGLGVGSYVASVEGMSYIAFIAPGLLMSGVMYQASFETTWNIHFKLEMRSTYASMLSTPLEPADLVLGDMLWGATRATITGVIFFAVIVVAGLVSSWWALAMPLAAALVAVDFASMGMLASAYIRDMNLYAYYYTVVIVPMFLFSGVFFQITNLPAWAQKVAWALPLFHGATLSRQLATGTVGPSSLVHVAYLVALPALLVPPTVRRMTRRLLG